MSICDCTKPVTRGLLDLTDPEYCFNLHNAKEDGYKSMSKPVSYKVVTTMDTVLKLQGLVCSQWIEIKRITGSFWIGSYDTEHFHTTKTVDPKECLDMKLKLNCSGNRNVVNAQDIELRQENKQGPILSPFGAHNVILEKEKLLINHNTVVWHKPNQKYNANNCKPKTQFESVGRLSLITVESDKNTLNLTRTGRLLDSEKQIEILFDPKLTFICTSINNAYKVTGIPDTYVVFSDNTEKYFPPIPHKKQRTRRQTALSETGEHSLSLAWGHITYFNFFPPTEFDEKFENKEYVVTTSEVENPLFLMPRVPPFNESIWHELGIWPGTQQEFDYSSDQSISFVSRRIRYCLTVNKPDHLLFEDCSISSSTWIYDAYRMYFMEAETRSCLTAVKDKAELLPCEMEPHSVKQMWKFDFKNTDETFRRAYPNITIEEWEFVQEELQSRPAESDTKDTEFSKQNLIFEYATDYTIRKFTSNMCLNIAGSTSTLIDCNENSLRWGINELTGQFMELHSLLCIENNKGQLKLGHCNDDQKPRNQEWKFEYHSPMLVNSTASPCLTPSVILEWHRNLSIYAIPFPPLPPIIQRANTIETPIDEPDTTTKTTAASSKTTTTTPKPTTTHYIKYDYNDAETNYIYYAYNDNDVETDYVYNDDDAKADYVYNDDDADTNYVYNNDDANADYVYNNDDAKADYVYNDDAYYVYNNDDAKADYVYNDDNADTNYVYNNDDAKADYVYNNDDAKADYVYNDDAKTDYVYNDDAKTNYV
ncbi:hypothetical protein DAPPUDRAFT_118161 [Daphnia pulex]|uniref:Uncharacterized protein n=1 Tax=Daphnia pulex TaxID=6669 RepID=E9HUX5_DAPPU|nr:hypothetical protein DAPPUDRAFT_118161 [Daphnia pulex]|eukprot:EFX64450.1 hypothetical protein DAPPUDRAFT_118161 [Daphnia pulex]